MDINYSKRRKLRIKHKDSKHSLTHILVVLNINWEVDAGFYVLCLHPCVPSIINTKIEWQNIFSRKNNRSPEE